MTEPTRNPTRAERARSQAQTMARLEDGYDLIEITQGPRNPQPVPQEPSPFDNEDE